MEPSRLRWSPCLGWPVRQGRRRAIASGDWTAAAPLRVLLIAVFNVLEFRVSNRRELTAATRRASPEPPKAVADRGQDWIGEFSYSYRQVPRPEHRHPIMVQLPSCHHHSGYLSQLFNCRHEAPRMTTNARMPTATCVPGRLGSSKGCGEAHIPHGFHSFQLLFLSSIEDVIQKSILCLSMCGLHTVVNGLVEWGVNRV